MEVQAIEEAGLRQVHEVPRSDGPAAERERSGHTQSLTHSLTDSRTHMHIPHYNNSVTHSLSHSLTHICSVYSSRVKEPTLVLHTAVALGISEQGGEIKKLNEECESK